MLTRRFGHDWEKWESSPQWWEQGRRGIFSSVWIVLSLRRHTRVKKDGGQEKPLDLVVGRTEKNDGGWDWERIVRFPRRALTRDNPFSWSGHERKGAYI